MVRNTNVESEPALGFDIHCVIRHTEIQIHEHLRTRIHMHNKNTHILLMTFVYSQSSTFHCLYSF